MRNQQIAPQEATKVDKRFDALLKKQEQEHRHLLDSHQKEMQELRDALRIAMEKFESLFQSSQQELKDFKTYTVSSLGILKEHYKANEIATSSNKRSIEDMNKQLDVFHDVYASKLDVDKFKKTMDCQIKEATMSHIIAVQDMQREVKNLFNFIKDDLKKFKCETEKRFCDLIDQIEKNFNVTKIDREGVLKEVRIYEKALFIIEKKIENIYTLIERMNNKIRGELLCHKPE